MDENGEWNFNWYVADLIISFYIGGRKDTHWFHILQGKQCTRLCKMAIDIDVVVLMVSILTCTFNEINPDDLWLAFGVNPVLTGL